jgi:hypothetical protein
MVHGAKNQRCNNLSGQMHPSNQKRSL